MNAEIFSPIDNHADALVARSPVHDESVKQAASWFALVEVFIRTYIVVSVGESATYPNIWKRRLEGTSSVSRCWLVENLYLAVEWQLLSF